MLAIYKREVKSYFTSMIGYVVITAFLLMLGFYYWGYNLDGQSPNMAYTLSSVSILYIIIIPILTMRSFAEEQRQRTDQLLFSAPVTVPEVVWGKFFAIVSVYSLPFIVICVMPLILSRFGAVNLLKNYGIILAFWLLGCVLISLGVFLSSITESQIVAAVIAILVNFVLWLMSSIATLIPASATASVIGFSVLALLVAIFLFLFTKNIIISGGLFAVVEIAMIVVYFLKSEIFESSFSNVLNSLSVYARFTGDFVDGTFNLGTIIYYLTFIGLFVYLTMQSVQKRRWS